MTVPVHRRPYAFFLSHAHKDRALVDALYRWLSDIAGFRVWYDAKEMSGGSLIASGLHKAVEQCRGMLVIASDDAVKSGWVKLEYNEAVTQMADSGFDFRVVPLRLENSDISALVGGAVSWIDVPRAVLTQATALDLLLSVYPGDNMPDPANSRDVYVSASWRSGDNASAQSVCRKLVDEGFRLIGDSKDQDGFGEGDRIDSIIDSCGAFVGVVPYRDADKANLRDKPYKYFLKEIDLAVGKGLPAIVIADPRIRRDDGDDTSWLGMATDERTCPEPVADAVERLWDEWRQPLKPHYVFCALDLDSDVARASSAVRGLIERVTGMRTFVGTDFKKDPVDKSIMQAITNAFLVLADISGDAPKGFNLDACIEAGMARAAAANVRLMARGETRSPPFMLRNLQTRFYSNEVEQLGVVHEIVRTFRRRVINLEL